MSKIVIEKVKNVKAEESKHLPKSKTIKMNWKQLEDVLSSHLHAIGVIPKGDDVVEMLIKKVYEPTKEVVSDRSDLLEFAEISYRYIKDKNA